MRIKNIILNSKVILVDMGNTLLDFHSGIHTDDEKDLLGLTKISSYLFKNFQLTISVEELKYNFLDKWYSDFYIREKDLIELDVRKYLNSALKSKSIELSEIDCEKVMKEFYSYYKDEVIVANNTLEFLKYLKRMNKQVGIISNCILYDSIYIDIFKSVNLDRYIDEYFFSYKIYHRKPSKEIYQSALDKFKVLPEETIMIGDSLKADIIGAKKIGIDTVWYNKSNKKNVDNVEFDLEISDFMELII